VFDSIPAAMSAPDSHPDGLGRQSATIAGIPGKVVSIVGMGTLPYFVGGRAVTDPEMTSPLTGRKYPRRRYGHMRDIPTRHTGIAQKAMIEPQVPGKQTYFGFGCRIKNRS
jgi:hypothetical protein